jgi:hypothetical protein
MSGAARALQGLGQDPVQIPDYTPPTIDPTSYLPPDPTVTGPLYSVPTPTTSTSGFWSTEIGSLLNQGVSILGKVVAPTTLIYNPKTGLYESTPASSAASASLLAAGTSTSSWLPLLLLGIGAIVILKAVSK